MGSTYFIVNGCFICIYMKKDLQFNKYILGNLYLLDEMKMDEQIIAFF